MSTEHILTFLARLEIFTLLLKGVKSNRSTKFSFRPGTIILLLVAKRKFVPLAFPVQSFSYLNLTTLKFPKRFCNSSMAEVPRKLFKTCLLTNVKPSISCRKIGLKNYH